MIPPPRRPDAHTRFLGQQPKTSQVANKGLPSFGFPHQPGPCGGGECRGGAIQKPPKEHQKGPAPQGCLLLLLLLVRTDVFFSSH